MTPKEKAKEFVNKFYFKLSNNGSLDIGVNNCTQRFNEAKDCALIAVNEILEILWHTHKNAIDYKYCQEIKKEIEKL